MEKRWCACFLAIFILMLAVLGGLTAIVDPYFHFHKPFTQFAYYIYNERYQNDGILKHFDYDAIITGTSLVENSKTSELDELFNTHSVKVPFSGASYKEIRENLERAFHANPNIKIVVWGLDYNRFSGDFTAVSYTSYPTYLYDDNPLNDVMYIFNKSILALDTCQNVLIYTQNGGHTTTFDEYKNWNANVTYGKEAIFSQVTRQEKSDEAEIGALNPENMEENVISLVTAHPEVEFYLFWPPYSILYYDAHNQSGDLKSLLSKEKEAIELMLPYDNLHFFSFNDEFDITTDLNIYKVHIPAKRRKDFACSGVNVSLCSACVSAPNGAQ